MMNYSNEQWVANDIYRIVLLTVLVLLVLLVSFATDPPESLLPTINKDLTWEMQRFNHPLQKKIIPKKKDGVQRILYLSNSHGLTGGKVSNHLQGLLSKVFPNEYEVIDLASGGMFTPEYVEKLSAGISYGADIVIAGFSYISFSDRMGLSNQAASAHNFFHPDVTDHLPLGFWLRNYDIGLYLDKLSDRLFWFYQLRNELRNLWESPIVKQLQRNNSQRILFLESEKNNRWRFPKGFNGHLFKWQLYSLGRDSHLSELDAFIQMANEHGVQLISANLPIDWKKGAFSHSDIDIKKYHEEIKNKLILKSNYEDYQNWFPVEFSTYDALHPTWQGARLHALSFSLLINKLREYPVEEETIYKQFTESDEALSEDFLIMLNSDDSYMVDGKLGMRRYDPSEPENARKLMRRFITTIPHSSQEYQFLYDLAPRFRYWEEYEFNFPDNSQWNKAVNEEITRFKKRVEYFKKKIIESQNRRLADYPLIDCAKYSLISSRSVKHNSTLMKINTYHIDESIQCQQFSVNKTEQTIANIIVKNGQLSRIYLDLFGDGSFVIRDPIRSNKFPMPAWVASEIGFKGV